MLSIPAVVNPNFDSTGANCGQGQAGNVWFLAGTFGGDPVTRSCTIPAGKGILIPVINTIVFANLPTDTIEGLRTGAVADIDRVITMRVTIDGFPLKDLQDLRVQSPVFAFTIPKTLFDYDALCSPLVPPGDVQICPLAVSDGYWVLLLPLRKGPHVIKFYAKKSDGFVVDVTYNLTIGP